MVFLNALNSDDPGGTSLDFFYEIDGHDNEVKLAQMEELLRNCGEENPTPHLQKFSRDFFSMSMRMRFNDIISCCFHSQHQLTREDIENYVKWTPIKKLKEAQIRI